MKYILPLALFISFLSTSKLIAQEVISMKSKTIGISAGAAVGSLSFRDDIAHPDGAEEGIGIGGHIQYGFSHKFSAAIAVQNYFVHAGSSNAADKTYPYMEADVTAIFTFGSTNTQLRPMLAAGATYTRMKETYFNFQTGFYQDEIYSGIGFVGGAGLSYFIKPELSVDLLLQIHSGYFSKTLIDQVQFNVQHSYYTFNGLLGVSYHF